MLFRTLIRPVEELPRRHFMKPTRNRQDRVLLQPAAAPPAPAGGKAWRERVLRSPLHVNVGNSGFSVLRAFKM